LTSPVFRRRSSVPVFFKLFDGISSLTSDDDHVEYPSSCTIVNNLFICGFSSILDSLDVEFICSFGQVDLSSIGLTNTFFDGTLGGSAMVFFTTGGVVLVRLVSSDGTELFVILLLTVVIERERTLDDEVCTTDGFDVTSGRIVFFIAELLVEETERVDATDDSFFVFDATGVGTFNFFTGVTCFINEGVVRIGNFEAFFTDNERLLLLLLLFDDEVFEFEELFKLVLRLVEQREGSREGRTTAGVVAAIVRVKEQRCTLEFMLRSFTVIFSGGEVDDSSCGTFVTINVSER
jgi:hypothetical protein